MVMMLLSAPESYQPRILLPSTSNSKVGSCSRSRARKVKFDAVEPKTFFSPLPGLSGNLSCRLGRSYSRAILSPREMAVIPLGDSTMIFTTPV